MNAHTNLQPATSGLALLRQPFPDHQVSKLPKPTKAQTDEVKNDYKKGVRCTICGTWHHPNVVHLDYVGHAALTDRLLDADPEWTWEPVGHAPDGMPAYDKNGGLWIKLTVCGVTRLGYGAADGKSGGDAVKEIIGDALRNAAMRFGAALDLWHKGDLHVASGTDAGEQSPVAHDPQTGEIVETRPGPPPRAKLDGPHKSKTALKAAVHDIIAKVRDADNPAAITAIVRQSKPTVDQAKRDWPELVNGDPDVPEDVGLRGALASARAAFESNGFTDELIESMKRTDTPAALSKWVVFQEKAVDTLDDADRRRFDAAYDAHESAVKLVAGVTAG